MILIKTRNGYTISASNKDPHILILELCRATMEVAKDVSIASGISQEMVFNELIDKLKGDASLC